MRTNRVQLIYKIIFEAFDIYLAKMDIFYSLFWVRKIATELAIVLRPLIYNNNLLAK